MVSSILIKFKQYLNWSIWSIDGTLTDNSIRGLSGPGSKDDERVTIFPWVAELQPHHQDTLSLFDSINNHQISDYIRFVHFLEENNPL